MKQFGSEIKGFSEKVEYKDVNGKLKVEYARFERLVTDQCMFRYMDARGREMIFAMRNTWGITHEGTLDRFLGIHFERSQDKWSLSATMGTYYL